MFALDGIKESSTTTGTGALTLAGAVSKYRNFSPYGAGVTFNYRIEHQSANEWEIGVGSISGGALVRTTVIVSSAGVATLQNFSAGTKHISVVPSGSASFIAWAVSQSEAPNVAAAGASAGGPSAAVTANGTNGIALGKSTSVDAQYATALGANANVQANAHYGQARQGGRCSHQRAIAEGPDAITRGYGVFARNVVDPISSYVPFQQELSVQWMRETLDATPGVMLLSGQGSTHLVCAQKTALCYDILLSAFEEGGTYRTWAKHFQGTIKRGTGNVALGASPVETVISADSGFTVSAALTADTGNQAIAITVTGLASTFIHWAAHGRIVENTSSV